MTNLPCKRCLLLEDDHWRGKKCLFSATLYDPFSCDRLRRLIPFSVTENPAAYRFYEHPRSYMHWMISTSPSNDRFNGYSLRKVVLQAPAR